MAEIKLTSRRNSILRGIGSTLTVFPRRNYIKSRYIVKLEKIKNEEINDILSIGRDWQNLGYDIYKAMDKLIIDIKEDLSGELFIELKDNLHKHYKTIKHNEI